MIQYLSLFSGIGAFEKALKNLKIPFDLVGFSEIDKYAIKSYCAIHDVEESLNFGDITKIDETKLPKDVDFLTYGFPCQDISVAGKMKGFFNEDGAKTRSGLFFDALRIIEAVKPKVAIAENVKNLTSKKFTEQFNVILNSLKEAGYNNYWAILNAKDFGILQNRERVFIVSIRKDADAGVFEFPEPYEMKLRLKDLLEDVVDEKFYLSESKINKIANSNFAQEREMIQKGDICGTLLARDYKDPKCVQVEPKSLTCMEGGNLQPMIVDKKGLRMSKFAKNKNVDLNVYRQMALDGGCDLPCAIDEQNVTIRKDGTVGTITTDGSSPKKNNRVMESNLRIRKLTPKECFRLMGFTDDDFEKAEKVNSNTQLYKQAGNSIVVDVAEELLCIVFDKERKIFI